MEDKIEEENIKANAEMVVQQFREISGIDFGYTQESVEWLEGYLDRLCNSGQCESQETKERLTNVFGSFLGECVIRCYGGRWQRHEGVLGVAFDDQNLVFPFAKVAKRLDNSPEDSIASFFTTIPFVFKNLPNSVRPLEKKPWWKVW